MAPVGHRPPASHSPVRAAPLAGEEVETGSPPSGGHYPSNFSWHGGITIPHPKVVICYWSGSGPYSGATIESATRDIVEGGYLTATSIYGGGPGEFSNTTYNLGQPG